MKYELKTPFLGVQFKPINDSYFQIVLKCTNVVAIIKLIVIYGIPLANGNIKEIFSLLGFMDMENMATMKASPKMNPFVASLALYHA